MNKITGQIQQTDLKNQGCNLVEFLFCRSNIKVPELNLDKRQSRSQGGIRNLFPNNNPITHEHEVNQQAQNSGNLWYHQIEAKDLQKRRQQMFLQGLNEQKKLEQQRKKIDDKFEAIVDYKTAIDKNNLIAKEDAEREAFHRHFEDASKKNDDRVNYYLNHYYAPPKEKDLRSNIVSERYKMNINQRRKIKVSFLLLIQLLALIKSQSFLC